MSTSPRASAPGERGPGTPSARRPQQTRMPQWHGLRDVVSRFAPYVARRKGSLGIALSCGLGYTVLGLLEPWPIKVIFDHVLLERPLHPSLAAALAPVADDSILLLNVLIAAILILVFVRGILFFNQSLLIGKVAQQTVADVRFDLYKHLQRLSMDFHDRRRLGDLLVHFTSDVRILRESLITLPISVVSELLLMIGMLVVMFLMDWGLTLLALAVLPLLVVLTQTHHRPLRRAMRKRRHREGRLATVAAEALGAIQVVQGFRRESHELERFNTQNTSSLRYGIEAIRLGARLRWASELAVAVVTVLILSVGVHRVLAGGLSPGGLLVFVYYLRAFNKPLKGISRIVQRTARGVTAGERLLHVLDAQPAIADAPGAVPVHGVRGDIRYDRVSFSYQPGALVLTDITLHIAPGEHVALIGQTGSGKTSLANLIPRFYDPTMGCVRLDGRDIREFTLDSLRAHISLVFQEPVLFATTVMENISYGKPDATRTEVVRAAELAGIHSIIAALPEGYDTVLGERGGTLSGGQRRCVSIARAIIMDAPITILDEPTVGLDIRSATLVMEALERLMQGRTVIMISHELRLVRNMDRVIVLESGRCVEEGPAPTLLARGGVYATLARLQSGAAPEPAYQ